MRAAEEQPESGTARGQLPRTDAPRSPAPYNMRQSREYIVHGPTSAPYFTLHVAAEAAAVSPPFCKTVASTLPPAYFHTTGEGWRGRKALRALGFSAQMRLPSLPVSPRRPDSLTSTLWQSSCTLMQHRWRFIKKDEFGLVRLPRPTEEMMPKHVLHSENFAVCRLAQEYSFPLGNAVCRHGVLRPPGARQSGELLSVPAQQLRLKKWGTRPVCLEGTLQDDDGGAGDTSRVEASSSRGTAPASSPAPTSAPSPIVKPAPAVVKAEATSTMAEVVVGEGGRATPGGGRTSISPHASSHEVPSVTLSSTVADTVAEARDRSPRCPSPTIAHAAQRLRDTLLTVSFQRMVDDLAEATASGPEEKMALVRHARIFRELSLLSRYHEMHPLVELRPASRDFLHVKSPRTAVHEVNSCFRLSKQPLSRQEATTALVGEGMIPAATGHMASVSAEDRCENGRSERGTVRGTAVGRIGSPQR
ncbi:hypothetical protein TraAM80_01828 [Trypanosoma rangeli]|uniref:Uncharacterized protein n=1 Tax=Trypanosoma rangeli TaxID=5698 RepID=A0A3R7KLW8_TRYRA|nr:uncharacterized protein TraAM80_01828 [Trypanosoma rangeli]RNF10079.1 hypothetical protein TraAM80_01828 [Trypanosoma rangeli]|eukprot:RNF10079.1 hypothetical protein TraAM80_01828 [Trypanosoma rangeli]